MTGNTPTRREILLTCREKALLALATAAVENTSAVPHLITVISELTDKIDRRPKSAGFP